MAQQIAATQMMAKVEAKEVVMAVAVEAEAVDRGVGVAEVVAITKVVEAIMATSNQAYGII